jgi:hypothetical protein
MRSSDEDIRFYVSYSQKKGGQGRKLRRALPKDSGRMDAAFLRDLGDVCAALDARQPGGEYDPDDPGGGGLYHAARGSSALFMEMQARLRAVEQELEALRAREKRRRVLRRQTVVFLDVWARRYACGRARCRCDRLHIPEPRYHVLRSAIRCGKSDSPFYKALRERSGRSAAARDALKHLESAMRAVASC